MRTLALAAALLGVTAAPSKPVREQTADQQVLHVLNRLAFGPRPGDVAEVRKMGVDAWIDEQLHPEKIDDSAMDQLLARYAYVNEDQNELAREYADFVKARATKRIAQRDTNAAKAMTAEDSLAFRMMNQRRGQLISQLESARIGRAVGSERQLLEVMTDFWENHFTVYVRKGAQEPYYLVDYDRTIREHALGKFRDLLGAVAHSPAMLFYLDNAESRANPGQPTLPAQRPGGPFAQGPGGMMNFENLDRLLRSGRLDGRLTEQQQTRLRQAIQNNKRAGLNENYGRELLELHTLGVDGGYSQQDVIEVARALTGWTIRPPAQGGGFIFRPEWHDAASKTILGKRFPSGQGEDEGERVLDMLARHPSTAHFIALKLARRFVSDSPSTALVDYAAKTYLRTDGDIREVVRAIVTSPEFFSQRAYRSKVKSPFEVVVSAARALGAQPDTTPRTAFAMAYLGQPLFGHQAPNGWPETGDAWMNTGAILNRINFGMAAAANRLPGATLVNLSWADSVRNVPREVQVDAVIQHILGGAVSPDTRKILVSGEHPFAQAAAAQANVRTVDTLNAEPAMSTAAAMDENSAQQPLNRQRNQNLRALLRNRGQYGGLGPPPNLQGLAQVVGLAIGSPEFQRR